VFHREASTNEQEGPNLTKPERCILACYEAWLREWKRHELAEDDGWHLWVGLGRPFEQVERAWKAPLEAFKEWQRSRSRLIHLKVRAFEANRGDCADQTLSTDGHPADSIQEPDYWRAELEAPRFEVDGQPRKKCLVFDNHGECFPSLASAERAKDFRESPRFYQTLTGSRTPDLFRLLSHPPSSPFASVFFIYSLVESCLANVAVVDERLAADLLLARGSDSRLNPQFPVELGEHHKAGVFPVFGMRQALGAASRYSEAHQSAFEAAVSPPEVAQREGLALAEDKPATLELLNYEEGRGFKTVPALGAEGIRCDALVIHEGVLDLIGEGIAWPSPAKRGTPNGEQVAKLLETLLAISPALVRMSGRGRHTKHFRSDVPFIEFSEVSAALLTSRNKFALVRGLFGTSGETEEGSP